MPATSPSPVVIAKEQVANLRFPSGEVLQKAEERVRRRAELDRALVLGNVDHNKVRIIFRDSEGLKQVETTIWAVTEERVILKSGMVIPIRCIMEIAT
ncbi:MAG: hypothetical protein FD123_1631 [Bacteroidetes bacterium]|nr:MAG: hypothetical protein FD123_1631 [Bacteroidota bacterium]